MHRPEAFTAYADEIPGVEEYLNSQDIRSFTEYYRMIARSMPAIGDTDLRQRTVDDLRKLHEIEHALATSAGAISDVVEELEDIVGGSDRGHAVLGKALALRLYTDIALQFGEFPRFLSHFLKVIQTDSDHRNQVLLTASLYGRIVDHAEAGTFGAEEGRQVFDSYLLGSMRNPATARTVLGVYVAAQEIAQMNAEDAMGMTTPMVDVVQGTAKEAVDWRAQGDGYPHYIVYLDPGRIVSTEKLAEAAHIGMPDTSGVLEHRLPRILAGVQIDKRTAKAISLKMSRRSPHIRQAREFYCIYLRALRKPDEMTDSLFVDPAVSAGAQIFFDSLSYMVALRVSDELTAKFHEIDQTEYPHKTPTDAAHARKLRKENAVTRAFGKWRETLSVPVVESTTPVSILSVALAESQAIDGKANWGPDEALAHIENTARALVLQSSMAVRSREEIARIYSTHIWRHELTRADKLEFAALVFNKGEVFSELTSIEEDAWIDRVEKGNVFVIKCETIYDKYGPEGLASFMDTYQKG